jgi:hypothetical protein
MDKAEVIKFVMKQYLEIKPYRDLIGEGIHPIMDCLIEGWEKFCVIAGFTEDEAEYIVGAIMRIDYLAILQFCGERNMLRYRKTE